MKANDIGEHDFQSLIHKDFVSWFLKINFQIDMNAIIQKFKLLQKWIVFGIFKWYTNIKVSLYIDKLNFIRSKSSISNNISSSSSVENQSLNEDTDEKNYATNIESEYLSSYSANQIPIAKFRPAILDFQQQ